MLSKISIVASLFLLLLNLYSIVDSHRALANFSINQYGMIYLFYRMVQALTIVVCLPLLVAILIWFKRQPSTVIKPAIVLLLVNLVLVIAGWLLLN